MLKRVVVAFGIQSIIMVILAVLVGMVAIFVGPTIGAVLAASEAGFAYNIVSPFVCPEGTALVAEEGAPYQEESFDGAGETTVTPTIVSCVGDTQVIPDMELQAFAAISTLTFLVCFLPFFIPLTFISLLIVWRLTKGITQKKMTA